MQYVNDDMDDVFRKAAENYPLDTSGADWKKVHAALQSEPAPEPASRKGTHRRFLWLLLLLPFAFVCNFYRADRANGFKEQVHSSKDNSQSVGQDGQIKGGKNQENLQDNPDRKTVEPGQGIEIDKNDRQRQLKESLIDGTSLLPAKEDGSLASGAGTPPTKTKATKLSTPKSSSSFASSRRKAGKRKTQEEGYSTHAIPGGLEGADLAAGPINGAGRFTSFISPISRSRGELLPASTAERQGISFKNEAVPVARPKKFYLGLLAGIDRTSVRFQKTTHTGFDYGILAGYQLGRRWSIEATAFLEKKYYYTTGDQFKPKNMYLAPNSWITDVTGNCMMYDLSLGATYSFSGTTRSKWFAGAGLSSYIMKKEDYDFTVYYGGSGTSAVHGWEYKNASKNFLAIANISAGYVHRIGKVGDLRIEPYVKLPLSGVGYGNLPLFSGGLHVGVTRKLF